jgi:sugar phosphate isomerase/epimerase
MRFGLSTHLFHGERLTRAHLERVAASGFDLIEVFATRTHFDYHDPRRVDELAGWVADLGLEIGSIHAPICDSFVGGVWGRAYSNASPNAADRNGAIAETTAAFDAAKRLACPRVVLHIGLPHGQAIPPGDNNPAAARRSLDALAAAADQAGTRLALEVMPNDLSTPDALLEFLDALDEDGRTSAGICLDFGHAHLMGGAPETAEALSGHIITTHVHDNLGKLDNHLVPFQGNIDWAGTLTAMWKVGYTGPLMFEVADHGDTAGVLTRTVGARTRLQAILDGLSEPFRFEE